MYLIPIIIIVIVVVIIIFISRLFIVAFLDTHIVLIDSADLDEHLL